MVVIPLMFLAALGIALFAVSHQPVIVLLPIKECNWLVAALQFTSYNVILSLPVLLAMAGQYPDKSVLQWGGWIGACILGIMTGFIYLAIISHFDILHLQELPMVTLAKMWSKPAFFGYTLIIWGEMVTTLLADLYGLGKRMVAWVGCPFRLAVLILICIGMAISGLGFTNLIARCYPVFGLLSLGILLMVYFKALPGNE